MIQTCFARVTDLAAPILQPQRLVEENACLYTSKSTDSGESAPLCFPVLQLRVGCGHVLPSRKIALHNFTTAVCSAFICVCLTYLYSQSFLPGERQRRSLLCRKHLQSLPRYVFLMWTVWLNKCRTLFRTDIIYACTQTNNMSCFDANIHVYTCVLACWLRACQ